MLINVHRVLCPAVYFSSTTPDLVIGIKKVSGVTPEVYFCLGGVHGRANANFQHFIAMQCLKFAGHQVISLICHFFLRSKTSLNPVGGIHGL